MQPRKEEGRSRKTTKATPRPGARAKAKPAKPEKTSARVQAVKGVKAPATAKTSTKTPTRDGASRTSTAKNGTNGHDTKKKVEIKELKPAGKTVKTQAAPTKPLLRDQPAAGARAAGLDAAADKVSAKASGAKPARAAKGLDKLEATSEPRLDPKSEAAKTNSSFARPSPWSAPVLPPVKVDPTKAEVKIDTEGEFRVGETVVYPARGVADIVAVEDKDIGGRRQSFYVLRVHDTEQKILVPVNNAAQIGLRRPISEAQVREIFRILKVTDVPLDTQTWNRRYRGFVEKLATGSVFAVAEVLRDLSRVKIVKDGLSFSERQMLERARGLIVKEIAVARAKPEDAVRQQIEAIFA